MRYRQATAQDIDAIAALHADSWRRNYRGAYSDEYLDGDVFEDRRRVWSERLTQPDPGSDTVVVEDDGVIVGFVHTILDCDPEWGALLDNLHVAADVSRQGIGTQLMAKSAEAVLARGVLKRLYLWVLEPNTRAQSFYEARSGECTGTEIFVPPGGGQITSLRYVWPDPKVLLR